MCNGRQARTHGKLREQKEGALGGAVGERAGQASCRQMAKSLERMLRIDTGDKDPISCTLERLDGTVVQDLASGASLPGVTSTERGQEQHVYPRAGGIRREPSASGCIPLASTSLTARHVGLTPGLGLAEAASKM